MRSRAGSVGPCVRGCAMVWVMAGAGQRKGGSGGPTGSNRPERGKQYTRHPEEEENNKDRVAGQRGGLGWAGRTERVRKGRAGRAAAVGPSVCSVRASWLISSAWEGEGKGKEGGNKKLLTGSESCWGWGRSRLLFPFSSSSPSSLPYCSSATAPVASGGSSGSEEANAVLLQRCTAWGVPTPYI